MKTYQAQSRRNNEVYKTIVFQAPSLRSAKLRASKEFHTGGTWKEIPEVSDTLTGYWVKRSRHSIGYILCNYHYIRLEVIDNP